MQPSEAALIGTSVAIQRVRDDAACAACADVKVLITGERGLGKETLCYHIHGHSRRSRAPLITVNCLESPDTVVAAQIPLAAQGTLFLDNVDALGPHAQACLWRCLEDGIDVRVVAASSRNLYERVRAHAFREDLYYRLNAIHIIVPPLRERREDVPPLVDHFLALFSRRPGNVMPVLSDDAMAALQSYDWPGNIRELSAQIAQVADGETSRANDPLEWITSPSRRTPAIP